MGLFRAVKSTWEKSKAATTVQNCLEVQAKAGILEYPPAELANKLVAAIWDEKPDIFNGKFGQRPHTIAVAAAALANGADLIGESNSSRNALLLSLGNILSEAETNGSLYPFSSMDYTLLDAAMNTFTEAMEDFESSPLAKELDAFVQGGSPLADTNSPSGNEKRQQEDKNKLQGDLISFLTGSFVTQIFVWGLESKDVESRFLDNWSLGYVGGFTDAFLQRKGVEPDDFGYSIMRASFIGAYGESRGSELFLRFLKQQDDPALQEGMSVGGQELIDFLNEKIEAPTEWGAYVKDYKGM